MAKVVICPSCQYQGSIPDEIQAKRIRCPKCKESFDVEAAAQSSVAGAKRPTPAKPPKPANTDYDDLENVQPLASVSNSGTRRGTGQAHSASAASGQSPMVYAAVGIGGLAVVLLCVVLVVMMTRGGGEPPARAAATTEVAQHRCACAGSCARPRGRARRGSIAGDSGFVGGARECSGHDIGTARRPRDCPSPEGGDGLYQEQDRGQDPGVRNRFCDRGTRRYRAPGDESSRRGLRY